MSTTLHKKLVKLTYCKNCKKRIIKEAITCALGHAICVECSKLAYCCLKCFSYLWPRKPILYKWLLEAIENDEHFTMNIINSLECPVCYDRFHFPVYMCYNGHGICKKCFFFTTICPICRDIYVPSLNSDINEILTFLDEPRLCIFSKNGCQYTSEYLNLLDHEKNCKFKDILCSGPDCYFKGMPNNLLNHVEEKHRDMLVQVCDDEKFAIIVDQAENESKFKYMKTHNNETFYLLSITNQDDKLQVELQSLSQLVKNDYFVRLAMFVNSTEFIIIEEKLLNYNSNEIKETVEKKAIFLPKQMTEKYVENGQLKFFMWIFKKPSSNIASKAIFSTLFCNLLYCLHRLSNFY